MASRKRKRDQVDTIGISIEDEATRVVHESVVRKIEHIQLQQREINRLQMLLRDKWNFVLEINSQNIQVENAQEPSQSLSDMQQRHVLVDQVHKTSNQVLTLLVDFTRDIDACSSGVAVDTIQEAQSTRAQSIQSLVNQRVILQGELDQLDTDSATCSDEDFSAVFLPRISELEQEIIGLTQTIDSLNNQHTRELAVEEQATERCIADIQEAFALDAQEVQSAITSLMATTTGEQCDVEELLDDLASKKVRRIYDEFEQVIIKATKETAKYSQIKKAVRTIRLRVLQDPTDDLADETEHAYDNGKKTLVSAHLKINTHELVTDYKCTTERELRLCVEELARRRQLALNNIIAILKRAFERSNSLLKNSEALAQTIFHAKFAAFSIAHETAEAALKKLSEYEHEEDTVLKAIIIAQNEQVKTVGLAKEVAYGGNLQIN